MTIKGINGEATITPPDNWQSMAPVSKVLWVHENYRDTTGGKPFEFVRA